MDVGLIPWLITQLHRLRGFAVVALVRAVVLQGVVQLGDGVVAATRFGRHCVTRCWPAIAVGRN